MGRARRSCSIFHLITIAPDTKSFHTTWCETRGRMVGRGRGESAGIATREFTTQSQLTQSNNTHNRFEL